MKTISQLTIEADKLFSEWIRRKDSVNGMVSCVCCGESFRWQDIQNGHFISRNRFPTRYEPANCHPQCKCCNSKHNEDRNPYSIYMLRTYKPGIISLLVSQSMKFTPSLDKRPILNNIIRDTKFKLKKLSNTGI